MVGSSRQHLYRIQHNPYYFHAGRSQNGDQVLLGVRLPELSMVTFDSNGKFVGLSNRPIPHDLLQFKGTVIRADPVSLSALVENWKLEIRFAPSTISVQRFFLEQSYIGIKDFPAIYVALMYRPDDFDNGTRHDLQENLRSWKEAGNFVLCWNQDYELSQDGKVISS